MECPKKNQTFHTKMNNDAVDRLEASRSVQEQLHYLHGNPNAASLMARVRQRFNEQRIARSVLSGEVDEVDLGSRPEASGMKMDHIIVTREMLWDVLMRLTDSRSPVMVMKQAEGELFALEPQPGYYSALFEILLSPVLQISASSEHQDVRRMVAVILRKDVERHWAAGGNRAAKSHKLSEDVKNEIRARVVDTCLSELRNDTSRAVADIIAKIARHDVPEPWSNLIEDDLLKRLSRMVESIDRAVSDANLAAVATAVELFARCAFLLERVLKSVASKRFIKHRTFFTNMPSQLFDPIGGMWINMLAKMRMFVDVNDPTVAKQKEFVTIQSRLLDAVLSLTKLLHHIIIFGASVQLRDAVRSREAGMEEAAGEETAGAFVDAANRVQEKLLNFFQLVYAVGDNAEAANASQSSSVYDQMSYIRTRCMQNLPPQQRSVCDTILKRLDKIVSRVIQNVGLTESINPFLPIILKRYQTIAFGKEAELERVPSGSLHQSLIILSSVITNAPTNFGAQLPQSTVYRCQLVADAFPEHAVLTYTRFLIRYAVLDEASRERLEENAEEFAIHSAPLEALNVDLRTSAQYCLARLTKLRSEAVLQALFALLSEPMLPAGVQNGSAVALAFHREALYSLVMCIKPQLFDYIATTKNSALLTQLHCKLHQDLHELLQLHSSLSSQKYNQQGSGGDGDNSRKRTGGENEADDDDDGIGMGIVLVCHRIVMTYGEYFFMPASDADCAVIRATVEQLQNNATEPNRLYDHYQFLLHAVSRRIAPPVLVRLAAVDVLQRRVFGDPKWADASHLAPYCHELLHHMEQLVSDCRSSEAREFVLSTVRSMVLAFRETPFPVPAVHTINLCRTTLCLNTSESAVKSTRISNGTNKRFCGGGGSGDSSSSFEEVGKSDISDIQLQTKLSVTQALQLVLQDTVMTTSDQTDRQQHVTFLVSDLVAALVQETLKPLVNEGFAEETLALYRELLKRMPSHEYMPANAAEFLLDSAIRQLLQSSARLTRQWPKQIADVLVEYTLLLPQYCAHTFGSMMIQWFLTVLRSRPPSNNANSAAINDVNENTSGKQHISLTREEQIALFESLSTLVLLFASPTASEQQPSPIQSVLPDLTRFALFQARSASNAPVSMTRVNEMKSTTGRFSASSCASDSGAAGKDVASRFSIDTWADVLCARVLYTTPMPIILLVIRESCVIPAAELAFAEHYYGLEAADAILQSRRAAEQQQRELNGGIDIACKVSARVNSAASHAIRQILSAGGKTTSDNMLQLSEEQINDVCERVLACTVQSLADQARMTERYASKWAFLVVFRLLNDNIGRVQYLSTFLLHFLNEIMVKQVRVCPRKRSPVKNGADINGPANPNDNRSLLPDTLMVDLVEKTNFHPEQASTPGERRRIELIDSNDAAYRVYTPSAVMEIVRKLRVQFGNDVFQTLLQSDTSAAMPSVGSFSPLTTNAATNMAIAFQMTAAAVAPLITHVLSEPTDNSF